MKDSTMYFILVLTGLCFSLFLVINSHYLLANEQYSCTTFYWGNPAAQIMSTTGSILVLVSLGVLGAVSFGYKVFRPFAVIIILVSISAVMFAPSIGYFISDVEHSHLHWSGDKIIGTYTILVYWVDNSTVSAANCPSSPGDLHGIWSYKNGLDFQEDYYRVYVEDGLITKILGVIN